MSDNVLKTFTKNVLKSSGKKVKGTENVCNVNIFL